MRSFGYAEMSTEPRKHRDDLMNFSPGGFRFFIPAILIAVILHSDEVDTLRDNIIYMLAPPALGDGPPHLVPVIEKILSDRVGILASQEKAAIRSFLEAYKDLEPYAGWDDIPSCRERLQRALEFWKEQ